MSQKPMLRGEVGCACVAREVSVEKGGMGEYTYCNLYKSVIGSHVRNSGYIEIFRTWLQIVIPMQSPVEWKFILTSIRCDKTGVSRVGIAPRFKVNLNHCARALFLSLALSTKPTLPPW